MCVCWSQPLALYSPLYLSLQVLGRNCRFLQGPETETAAVAVLVAAVRSGSDCCVRLTNYKRDGTTFKNLLTMRAMADGGNTTRFFMGVQKELTAGLDVAKDAAACAILCQLVPPLFTETNSASVNSGGAASSASASAQAAARQVRTPGICRFAGSKTNPKSRF